MEISCTPSFGNTMKKVALKFCGGCDPGYDRTEYWERIRSAAGEGIEWVSPAEDGRLMVLLISGCRRACPEALLHLPRLISLTDPVLDPRQVVTMLTEEERYDRDQD
jgi:hypothetical protein